MRSYLLQTVGPWGWLGWVLFGALAMLFARFWTSDAATAMRRMKNELNAARQTISELRAMEAHWAAEKKHLESEVERLVADNQDLHASLDRMKVANKQQSEVIKHQGDTIERLEQNQKQILARLGKADIIIDGLKDRVIKLEAQRGDLPSFPDPLK